MNERLIYIYLLDAPKTIVLLSLRMLSLITLFNINTNHRNLVVETHKGEKRTSCRKRSSIISQQLHKQIENESKFNQRIKLNNFTSKVDNIFHARTPSSEHASHTLDR